VKIAEIKLHPEGEKDFEFQFAPSGGTHKIVATDDELSAYGGIVAWDHFLERTGIVDTLHLHYPKLRTSPNATPVKDILKGIMLNFLLGGTRFAHQRRLQDDRAVANILGLTRGKINGEDAFRRLCQGLDKEQMRQWMRTAEQTLYHATPSQWIADWDSTVITKYAEQEDTAIGYNPQKPGRKSLHPLVCVVAGTRLALHMRWRRGNTVSATQWIEAMEEVYSHPEAQARLKLNRGDIGFGQEKIMAWHEGREKKRPKYLFKLKQTANVKRAIAKIKWPEKLYDNEYGIEQYAESRVKISGWSCERRIVVTRTLRPRKASPQDELWDLAEEEYCVYVTNLELEEADAAQVVICYRKRADSENVFDELKNQWGFEGFSYLCARHYKSRKPYRSRYESLRTAASASPPCEKWTRKNRETSDWREVTNPPQSSISKAQRLVRSNCAAVATPRRAATRLEPLFAKTGTKYRTTGNLTADFRIIPVLRKNW